MSAGLNQPVLHADATPLPGSDLMLGPGKRYWQDRIVKYILFAAAFSSVAVTTEIVAILLFESTPFFGKVPLWAFLTGTTWTPQFEPPQYGIPAPRRGNSGHHGGGAGRGPAGGDNDCDLFERIRSVCVARNY